MKHETEEIIICKLCLANGLTIPMVTKNGKTTCPECGIELLKTKEERKHGG